MKVLFNINLIVQVKLTDKGRDELFKKNYPIPKENDEGWSTWQMHELMHQFGPQLYNGCVMPFSPEIVIEL